MDELWDRIGDDFDNGIMAVTAQAEPDTAKQAAFVARLTEHLAQDAAHEAAGGVKPRRPVETLGGDLTAATSLASPPISGSHAWLERWWRPIGLALLLILLAVTSWRAWQKDERLVIATHDLRPGAVLRLGDFARGSGASQERYLDAVLALENSVLRSGVERGGAVTRADVRRDASGEPAQREPPNRRLVTLPLKAGALAPSVEKGSVVSLLLSPRTTSAGSPSPDLLTEVLVVEVERHTDGATLTAAVTAGDQQRLNLALGASDIVVVAPLP